MKILAILWDQFRTRDTYPRLMIRAQAVHDAHQRTLAQLKNAEDLLGRAERELPDTVLRAEIKDFLGKPNEPLSFHRQRRFRL
jgi:hypothetical protein